MIFLEGVYLDRLAQGRKPRFVKGETPTDADIADVVQTISRRVIRTLRHLGYLEAGIDTAVATGDDPLVDDEPEIARTMAAITQEAMVTRILRHLKLAPVPPPIAPARSRQEAFDWVASLVKEPPTSRHSPDSRRRA